MGRRVSWAWLQQSVGRGRDGPHPLERKRNGLQVAGSMLGHQKGGINGSCVLRDAGGHGDLFGPCRLEG